MKKFLVLILSILMIFSMALFVGCFNNKQFKVTFDANGGAQVAGDNVQLSQTVSDVGDLILPTFEREGYEFIGWNVAINEIDEDTVVKALWKACRYQISFDVDGGTWDAGFNNEYKITATFGEEINEPLPTATKAGYTLEKWVIVDSDEAIDGQEFSLPSIYNYSKNIKLKIQWKACEYKISFDVDGGVWNTGFNNEYQVEATFGEVVSGTFPTATKTGFKFGGWKIVDANEEYNGKTFSTTEEYSYAQDLTLKINWLTSITYLISYSGTDSNGLKESFYENDSSFTLVNPTKMGYTFDGWTGDGYDTPTKEITINPVDIKANLAFTANWTANKYKLSFDNNGGEWDTGFNNEYQVEATFDSVVSGTFPTATLAGFKFGGWIIVDANTELNGRTFNPTVEYSYAQDLTLKINWLTSTTYLITYLGTDPNGLKESFYENDKPFTLTNPSKIGYTFDGWTGEGYDSPTKEITINPVDIKANLAFTANWTANKYKLSFDNNGGEWDTGFNNEYQVETTFDSVVSGTFPTATLAGFKFGGWIIVDANAELNGRTFNPAVEYSYAQDLTLKINWVESIIYTISYTGTDSNGLKESFYENDSSFTLINPSKTGYTFDGWTGEGYATPTKEIIINPAEVTDDLTFTAKWTANKYKLSFDNNGGEWDTGFNNEYQVEATFGEVVSGTLPTATLAGFKFGGWIIVDSNAEINGKTFNPAVGYSYAQDLTLQIKWIDAGLYRINYVNADSNGLIESFYENDSSFTLTNPSKTGYTFDGWTGEGYATPTKEITINPAEVTDDLTFTAKWTAKTYTITLVDRGQPISQKSVVYGQPIGELPAPNESKYFFAGWTYKDYLFDQGNNTQIWMIDEGDITLEAKWTGVLIVYNLNFYNSNKDEYYPCKVNGQSTVEEIVVQTYASLYDAIKDLPDPVPNDASEYKFSYWAYKKNDKYYKITSETLISDADIVNGVITIYARCRSLWIGPF